LAGSVVSIVAASQAGEEVADVAVVALELVLEVAEVHMTASALAQVEVVLEDNFVCLHNLVDYIQLVEEPVAAVGHADLVGSRLTFLLQEQDSLTVSVGIQEKLPCS
jgi:hypothetical protein